MRGVYKRFDQILHGSIPILARPRRLERQPPPLRHPRMRHIEPPQLTQQPTYPRRQSRRKPQPNDPPKRTAGDILPCLIGLAIPR